MMLSPTSTVLAISVLVGGLGLVLFTVFPTLLAGPQRNDPHMLHWGMIAVLAA